MKTKTLLRVLNWFKEYQSNLDEQFAVDLYNNQLIPEELEETNQAFNNGDLVEALDGLGDTVWVILGSQYFNNDMDFTGPIVNVVDAMFLKLEFTGEPFTILDELINIIADSNYSKTPNQKTEGPKKGKVEKGDKFIPPTKGIKKLIKKYNIKLRENPEEINPTTVTAEDVTE